MIGLIRFGRMRGWMGLVADIIIRVSRGRDEGAG